jgi:GNAT superfamily N-acetyltransferase
MTITIRAAGIEDAAAIAGIRVRSWQAAYRGMVPDSLLDGLSTEVDTPRFRGVLERLTETNQRAWIAEDDGMATGFAISGPPQEDDLAAGAGEVHLLYLEPDRRRGGIGGILLDHAVADLRADGFAPIVLWTLQANTPARAFYEAGGWRHDGTVKAFVVEGIEVPEVRYVLGDS